MNVVSRAACGLNCPCFVARLRVCVQDVEQHVLSSTGPDASLRVHLMKQAAMSPGEVEKWRALREALMAAWFSDTPSGAAVDWGLPLSRHLATLAGAYWLEAAPSGGCTVTGRMVPG